VTHGVLAGAGAEGIEVARAQEQARPAAEDDALRVEDEAGNPCSDTTTPD